MSRGIDGTFFEIHHHNTAEGKYWNPALDSFTAEKEGYESQTQVLHTTLNGWYLGNIIFGGLIGLLLVDPATGAMWSFDTNTLIFNLDKVEE